MSDRACLTSLESIPMKTSVNSAMLLAMHQIVLNAQHACCIRGMLVANFDLQHAHVMVDVAKCWGISILKLSLPKWQSSVGHKAQIQCRVQSFQCHGGPANRHYRS